MDKINYPLLYFEFQEEAVLGILVGTELEAIDSDFEVSEAPSWTIFKSVQKYDDYPLMDIMNPPPEWWRLPSYFAYRNRTGSYPLPTRRKYPFLLFLAKQKGLLNATCRYLGRVSIITTPGSLTRTGPAYRRDFARPAHPWSKSYRFQMLPRPSLDILPPRLI